MPKVVKVNVAVIDKFIDAVSSHLELTKESPHKYERLRARSDSRLIIVYSTGKVVYDDDPSIQRAILAAFRALDIHETFDILVGSDEAGKGEWLGPMVVAAVAVDRDTVPLLQSEGIMDSKLLNTGRIRQLADTVAEVSIAAQTTVVSPARFNELFRQLKAEGKSLNKLLAWAHKTALETVLTDELLAHGSVRVVVDEFDRFWSQTEFDKLSQRNRIQLELYPKAEENVAVAAASIMARAAREEWIDKKSQELGVNLREMTSSEIVTKAWREDVAKLSYLKAEGPS